jgi:acyl dehydratase
VSVKTGWEGRFFEDFEVGDEYRHPLGRTVTQHDNIWFTLLTQNVAAVHFDGHYAAKTEFGKPLVNSCFTLALVTIGHRRLVQRLRQPRLGRGAIAEPGVRG